MWIFLIEIAGTILSLGGWLVLHSFWLLLAGSLMILVFDLMMFTSGGQIKNYGLSVILLIAGGIFGGIGGYGIPESALLFFSFYSAVTVLLKLILILLALLDNE